MDFLKDLKGTGKIRRTGRNPILNECENRHIIQKASNLGTSLLITAFSVKKITCCTLDYSENIVRGVFNNLTPRYKAAKINIALRNLEIEMGLATKNGILLLIKCNIVFFSKG